MNSGGRQRFPPLGETEGKLLASNSFCRATEIQISDSTLWAEHIIVSSFLRPGRR